MRNESSAHKVTEPYGVKVGDKFKRPGEPKELGTLRVMAIAEGFAMVRRFKGGTFCERVQVIAEKWIRI